jgi:carboxymethylenebutenolidase
MKAWLLLALLLLPLAASAADGRAVTYKSGDETVTAMLYTPAGKGPFPALVVIHEWWGLNGWVKEQASKLADQGYVTLAVDLYRGQVATDPGMAHELMRGVPEDRALRDLLAAANFLRAQKKVKAAKVGAIGWCMGGGYSARLAENDPKLAAAVINYGSLSTDPATLGRIQAPILGIFGGQDRGIPPSAVEQFQKQMQGLGKEVSIKIYDDAGHAFENPNNKSGYRAADAADAWKRTVAFLAAKLK